MIDRRKLEILCARRSRASIYPNIKIPFVLLEKFEFVSGDRVCSRATTLFLFTLNVFKIYT
jgi:hypothetical protein